MTKSTKMFNTPRNARAARGAIKKGQLIKLLGTKTVAEIKTQSEKLGW